MSHAFLFGYKSCVCSLYAFVNQSLTIAVRLTRKGTIMIRIHIETFIPDKTQSAFCQQFGHVDGLLDVTFDGRTRQCEARHYDGNYWIIRGVLVTYPFSIKQWAAALYYFPDTGRIWLRPNDHALQGNRWPAPRLCGFVEDLHDKQSGQGT